MRSFLRGIKKCSLNTSFVIAGTAISLFLGDWLLGVWGFPSQIPQRVSHPPNYQETRKNIEFQYVFKTNDLGLRYRKVPLEKPTNTHRVFVVGDSFTEGVGIASGKRFADLLEEHYKSLAEPIQFLNGGRSKSHPQTYKKLFQEIGLKYHPDALLINIFVNDLAETPDEGSANTRLHTAWSMRTAAHKIWPRISTLLQTAAAQHTLHRKTKTTNFVSTITEEAQRRAMAQSEIDRWEDSLPKDLVKAINQGRFNGAILSMGLLYPKYWSDSIDIRNTRAKKKFKKMKETLTQIIEQSKQNGIEAALVFIPANFQYDPESHSKEDPWVRSGSEIRKEWLSEDTEIQKGLSQWAASNKLPFLDLTPVFREAIKSHDSLNWRLDGHWNNLGHRVAADAIASWLDEKQIYSFIPKKVSGE